MNSLTLAIAATALGLIGAVPLSAQNNDQDTQITLAQQTPVGLRVSQVVDMLNGELQVDLDEVFTEEFLAAVPPAQLAALSTQLTGSFGKAIGLERLIESEGAPTQIEVRMERAIAKGVIALDPGKDDRIIGLRFTSFDTIDDNVEKITADLQALPGTVSAYFAPQGGEPIIDLNSDTQTALGSTFKLYVLGALAEDIKDGKRAWSDIVQLSERSFPSGQMQDWNLGSPVTLYTLAAMMISISDNTATDELIKLLGRERVLQFMKDTGHSKPSLNDPFLTTQELFELKSGDRAKLEAYGKANAEERLDILADPIVDPTTVERIEAAFANGPVALDVEWFASARDLEKLFAYMGETSDELAFGIMMINPNANESAKEKWDYIGYKGGSEPGVLNLTWLLGDEQGEVYTLTLGWNNPDAVLDETKLELIAQRILSLPR